MSFQLRQGTDADRATILFDIGELVYTIDTKKVFIGDGTTLGGTDIYQLHNHDTRYFTQAQIAGMLTGYVSTSTFNTHVTDLDIHRTINDGGISVTDLWSANKIGSELSQKSNTGHNHDDRYYTEIEINQLLSTLVDQHVKVSSSDTVEGFLNNKILDGQGLTKQIINQGGNEILNFGADVFVTQINGVDHPCFISNGKVITTTMMNFLWIEGSLGNNEWVDISQANASTTGHIMPFDGVIQSYTLHVADQNNKNLDFHLYINEVDQGILANLDGNGEQSDYGNIDVNFNQGDKIQLRVEDGQGGSNPNDFVGSVFVRWRA